MLTARRAFVVQIDSEACFSSGSFTGRIEHISSGEARRFAASGELLAFIREHAGDADRSARAMAASTNDTATNGEES